MDIVIRPAQIEDVDAIVDLYNDAILNTTALFIYDPVTKENRAQWLSNLQQKGYPCLVAQVDGQFAGYCNLGPFHEKPAYDRLDLFLALHHSCAADILD